MKRYTLKQSDMPLRARHNLPLIPRTPPLHNAELEKSFLHVLLVTLDLPERIPHLVWFVCVAGLDVWLAQWLGVSNVVLLAIAQFGDWVLLMALSRRRISFGPVQPQWLALVMLRIGVAFICNALPMFVVADLNLLNVVLQAIGSVHVYYGYHIEPSVFRLSRIELTIPSFKQGSPMRLLHIADVHLERQGRREAQLLQTVRELQPDALLFTGDFLNLSNVHDPIAQQQAHELWKQLCAVAPVYAVTGSPPVDAPEAVTKIMEGLPIVWLCDEARDVTVCGNALRIVGTSCTHEPKHDSEVLRRVLVGDGRRETANDPPSFTILLHHSPDLAPQAAATGLIDLQLSGHTHGGQVRLPWFGALVTASFYLKALEMGLYQLNDMLLFVSRGIGLEGKGAPRVRFNCRPEVTLLVLRAE